MATPTKRTRDDSEYVIEAAAKTLTVLEALAEDNFKPVDVPTIQARTKFTYDFCRRALRTLKSKGWAIETDRGWQMSVKAAQFSEKYLTWAMSLSGKLNS